MYIYFINERTLVSEGYHKIYCYYTESLYIKACWIDYVTLQDITRILNNKLMIQS